MPAEDPCIGLVIAIGLQLHAFELPEPLLGVFARLQACKHVYVGGHIILFGGGDDYWDKGR